MSFQDFAKTFAPWSWSSIANASTSTLAPRPLGQMARRQQPSEWHKRAPAPAFDSTLRQMHYQSYRLLFLVSSVEAPWIESLQLRCERQCSRFHFRCFASTVFFALIICSCVRWLAKRRQPPSGRRLLVAAIVSGAPSRSRSLGTTPRSPSGGTPRGGSFVRSSVGRGGTSRPCRPPESGTRRHHGPRGSLGLRGRAPR